MASWYLGKIRYQKEDEAGSLKTINEVYLVDAISYTESEARLYKQIATGASEFTVTSISRMKLADLFAYEEGEKWFKAKVIYVSVDEKSGKEKKVVNYMLVKRPDVRQALMGRKARVLIMAQSEMETDLPERSNWKKPAKDDRRLTPGERENYDKPGGIASMTDREYWNRRARGMGGNVTSCAEENLLGYEGTRYYGEHILVHEFSHNIMGGLRTADTALYKEIEIAYEAAKTKGLYKGQYAINTVAEYWAEGTQWWFWSNIEFYDGQTRIQTPDDLKAYDPALYNILDRVYQGHHIPADVYYSRNLRPARRQM